MHLEIFWPHQAMLWKVLFGKRVNCLISFFNLFQAMNSGKWNRFNSLNLCIHTVMFNIRKEIFDLSLVFSSQICSVYTVVFTKYNSNSEGNKLWQMYCSTNIPSDNDSDRGQVYLKWRKVCMCFVTLVSL